MENRDGSIWGFWALFTPRLGHLIGNLTEHCVPSRIPRAAGLQALLVLQISCLTCWHTRRTEPAGRSNSVLTKGIGAKALRAAKDVETDQSLRAGGDAQITLMAIWRLGWLVTDGFPDNISC